MRMIKIQEAGGPEELVIEEAPIPRALAGTVVVRVRAFGINRAEVYMRQGAWGQCADVTGIECVGEVHEDGDQRLCAGQRVFALMGGMGRSIRGSYAEYVRVPRSNVVLIDSELPWEVLAAIPESYATAYSCLISTLGLQPGQTLLVRAGTSSLGQAAIDVAVHRGARVFATTRSAERAPLIERMGAIAVYDDSLPSSVDAVLDLIGTSTLVHSMSLCRRGGRVCVAGFLGGHAGLDRLDPVLDLPSGVHLSVFASLLLGKPGFELSSIPFQAFVDRAEAGVYRIAPARVFAMGQIVEAHRLMESDQANGKLVVLTGEDLPASP